ncbi:unnamed protein product, partial [Ectocarpus sp. 12 AP-2014]
MIVAPAAPAAVTSAGKAPINKRKVSYGTIPRGGPQLPQRERFRQERSQLQVERSPAAGTLDEPLGLDGSADAGMEQQQEEEAQDPTAKPMEGGKQQHPPPPPASWSPRLDVASVFLSDHTLEEDAAKLADLRLQIQASKLAFVVEKRREALVELGFTMRREEAAVGPTANTIQEFLDRTWAGRHVSRQGFSPLDSGGIECPVPFGYKRDGVDSLKISVLRKQCTAKFGSGGDGGGRGRSSR